MYACSVGNNFRLLRWRDVTWRDMTVWQIDRLLNRKPIKITSTQAHNINNPDEKSRVEAAGGTFENGRLFNKLQPTRTFGNRDVRRWDKPTIGTPISTTWTTTECCNRFHEKKKKSSKGVRAYDSSSAFSGNSNQDFICPWQFRRLNRAGGLDLIPHIPA